MRTNPDAVIAILGKNFQAGDDVGPYIVIANQIVTDNCIYLVTDQTPVPYPDSKLELIERWLSGWAYLVMNPARKFEAAGPVQKSTESVVGFGFSLNKYGQTAKLLDNYGALAALENSQKLIKKTLNIGVTWVGTKNWCNDPTYPNQTNHNC